MLRVVIAEDSVLLREGLVRLIEDSGAVVVARVGDGPSLVAAVVEHRPDVSVVDVRMPPTQRDEGLRAAIEARRRVPGSPVLVLSQYVERQYASELLADGAGGVGYLLKDRVADVREFMDALRRVAAGGTALDPEVVAQLMVRRRRDDRLTALTPRERDVLAAMAEGRTNVGIATALGITRGRRREAHQQHLRQARPARLGRTTTGASWRSSPTSAPTPDRAAVAARPAPEPRPVGDGTAPGTRREPFARRGRPIFRARLQVAPRARVDVDQRELVERAQRGDHDAFAVLAGAFVARLDAAARLILRDHDLARDAVQEGFIGAWRNLPTLRDPDAFEAWLHRLVFRSCIDILRRRGRRPIEVELTPIDGPAIADVSSIVADREVLDEALRRLDPEWRAVVVLHYYLGLPLPAVAATLGIPLGTAKSRLHRSLAAMRLTIEVEPDDPGSTPLRQGQYA